MRQFLSFVFPVDEDENQGEKAVGIGSSGWSRAQYSPSQKILSRGEAARFLRLLQPGSLAIGPYLISEPRQYVKLWMEKQTGWGAGGRGGGASEKLATEAMNIHKGARLGAECTA